MAEDKTSLVVDTNCFIRLLNGPRPLIGAVLGEFRLVTIHELQQETMVRRLVKEYPDLGQPQIQHELALGTLSFKRADQKKLDELADDLRAAGQTYLNAHCNAQKIDVRTLSRVDAKAWAAAMQLQGALATDEWPLRFAAELIGADDEGGGKVKLYSSVSLLALLEQHGRITALERWNLMREWRVTNERLHREADAEYTELFGEVPPTGQSPKR
jgi:hypothetical protein